MEKVLLLGTILLIAGMLILVGCNKKSPAEEVKAEPFTSEVVHPDWSKSVNFYEVNLRQYTEEGSFSAFAEHLPRLKELGVDVLWFMPIHPIGIKNRKGELGSYYSVQDYKAVNPEHGTLEDFRSMLNKAHELGFFVQLDWVPNHTSWDHPWAESNPEWYMKNEEGSFIPPLGFDWTDVIQLDWENMEMQDAMLDALKFWVEMGVDGFRVDHPHKTPPEFWDKARIELTKIRPVLMLAENEEQTEFLVNGFDMNYAWELHHMMNEVAQGKKNVSHLRAYFEKENSIYPQNIYRMRFLSNHDENSWQGTIEERMGESHEVMAVFMFTMPGVPLLYGGQEACLDKRLEFFTRDPIEWKECDKTGLYKDLMRIKRENQALWNGEFGGPMKEINTSKPKRALAFSRQKDDNTIISILNLSRNGLKVKPVFSGLEGEYTDAFNGQKVQLPLSDSLKLEAWDYLVLFR
ncbi:alpha-amylase family glycosyl hydrolase [Bacteroidota bacterium]